MKIQWFQKFQDSSLSKVKRLSNNHEMWVYYGLLQSITVYDVMWKESSISGYVTRTPVEAQWIIKTGRIMLIQFGREDLNGSALLFPWANTKSAVNMFEKYRMT